MSFSWVLFAITFKKGETFSKKSLTEISTDMSKLNYKFLLFITISLIFQGIIERHSENQIHYLEKEFLIERVNIMLYQRDCVRVRTMEISLFEGWLYRHIQSSNPH